VLGLGAHIVSVFNAANQAANSAAAGFGMGSGIDPTGISSGLGFAFPLDFAALGIAVSLLTLMSLIPLYVASCSCGLNIN
jgi:hypothetical protein